MKRYDEIDLAFGVGYFVGVASLALVLWLGGVI